MMPSLSTCSPPFPSIASSNCFVGSANRPSAGAWQIGTRLDGKAAAATVARRKRAVFYNVLDKRPTATLAWMRRREYV